MRCRSLFSLLALAGVREANAQHLLTDLVVTPCLNNTLVPAFSTNHYLYTATEADPLTAFVAITATPADPSSTISVLVDGKDVPASRVPLVSLSLSFSLSLSLSPHTRARAHTHSTTPPTGPDPTQGR